MSRNTLYANEIATANNFIIEHNNDGNLLSFIERMKNPALMHSDRWSMIYDYMQDHYPAATGSIVTGLTYWCEE